MKTKSTLAIRFTDWYDSAYNKYKELFPYYVNKAENILKKYLDNKLDDYYIDEVVDLLPEKGKSELEEFLDQMEV